MLCPAHLSVPPAYSQLEPHWKNHDELQGHWSWKLGSRVCPDLHPNKRGWSLLHHMHSQAPRECQGRNNSDSPYLCERYTMKLFCVDTVYISRNKFLSDYLKTYIVYSYQNKQLLATSLSQPSLVLELLFWLDYFVSSLSRDTSESDLYKIHFSD